MPKIIYYFLLLLKMQRSAAENGREKQINGEYMRKIKYNLPANLKSTFIIVEVARKTVQILFLAIFGSALWSLPTIPLALPILFSSGLPFRTIEEALSLMQGMIYESVFPWLPLASILIFGALTGRLLCGWICPLGLIQDILMLDKPGGKRRIKVPYKTHKSFTGTKYVILGVILLISISLSLSRYSAQGAIYRDYFGVFAQAPFTALSPSDTLFSVLPRLLIDMYLVPVYELISPLLIVRLTILIAVLILALYIPRAWCRYLCPQGALSAIVSRFSLLGLRREPVKCIKARCHVCEDVCPMMVPILSLDWEKITDPECIYCLRCVTSCPTKAIKPKFP
jgi:polyferredoxin